MGEDHELDFVDDVGFLFLGEGFEFGHFVSFGGVCYDVVVGVRCYSR